MAGPREPADVTVSTASLRRIVQYEPDDLTISVEAGLPWVELTSRLAEHRQMIPLDPPFAEQATVGGVVAANTNGPRRRLYGAVRDVVIGMTFATLEGKLVRSGGTVVKNVAGLDMAKVMIGSFGTLAAIAVVNFKLTPVPEQTRTFIGSFRSVDDAVAARDAVLASALQPAAIDLLNPAASARVDLEGWCLLVQAGGSSSVLERYVRELSGYGSRCGGQEASLWNSIREFTPAWMVDHRDGAVVRVPGTLTSVGPTLRDAPGPAIARAGTGTAYLYFAEAVEARIGGKAVIDFSPAGFKEKNALWPEPGGDFAIMERIKDLFDPRRLLNRRRLYGRI
jgi:glycolate oxidase FAD binding subunit